ncbi:MAG: hypothetical protein Kow0013_09940 [Pararhodobacter sp.]
MRLALVLAAALLATPVAAFTPDRAALMVDAVRANGCRMAGSEAAAALSPLGLDPIEVQSFVDVLFLGDLITLSEDMEVLSLAPALCEAEGDAALALIVEAFEGQEAALEAWSPEFEPQNAALLVGAVRGNGCALSDEEAGAILPPLGFTPATARDIVAVLVDTDNASISEDSTVLRLSDALCAADPATDGAAMEAAIAAWQAVNQTPEESQ